MKRIGMFWMCPHRLRLDGEGIGRYCVRLAEGLLLKREDVKVSVVTNPGNAEDIAGIFSVVQTTFPERMEVIAADDLLRVNRNIDVDIWIVPYVGLNEAQYLFKPYVICVHDLFYIHFPELRNSPQVAYIDASVKQLAARAAAAVFNSDYIRRCEGISYLGFPADRTRVIPLAPPVEEYGAFGLRDESDFRRQYGLHNEYIAFPSVIRDTKNHDRLVKAFHNFKQTEEGKRSQVCLVLTDRLSHHINRPEIRAMEARCHECGIYFIDRLPSADMPSLYRYSVGAIVPTLFEGSCPFPILESLIMERPVAFSRIEVAKELIPNWEEFITFNPYSVEDIQRGIYQLCHADPGVASRQKAAIGDVLSRTWQDVAADYYSLLAQISGKS